MNNDKLEIGKLNTRLTTLHTEYYCLKELLKKADKLLKKWSEYLEYEIRINSCDMQKKYWVTDEGEKYSEEYTTLMKDTIKYVDNLAEKEKEDEE